MGTIKPPSIRVKIYFNPTPALKKTHDNLYDRSMNNLTLEGKLESGVWWGKEAVVWMSTISQDPEIENGQSTIIWPRSCPDSTIRELSQPYRRIHSLILNKCSRWSFFEHESKRIHPRKEEEKQKKRCQVISTYQWRFYLILTKVAERIFKLFRNGKVDHKQ